MMSQSSSILLAVLLLAIGFIIGALVASLFTGREKDSVSRRQNGAQEDPERVEMFRVIRNRQDGKLMLRVGNETYASSAKLPATVKPALRRLLAELAGWLGLQPTESAELTHAPVGKLAPSAVMPPARSSEKPAVMLELPKRTLSIVEQINDLLHERLAASPLKERGINLVEDPREGVVVWVGIEKFIGIDAVTDEEVRAFINQVVAEWEARQSGQER